MFVPAQHPDIHPVPRRPLSGRTVVVTRSVERSGSLSRLLEELGADVLLLPLIRTEPAWNPHLVQDAFDARADWVAFTSASGVDQWLAAWETLGRPEHPPHIASVGRSTSAALTQRGFVPEIVPARSTSMDLAAALLPHLPPGTNLLWPHGNLADSAWTHALRSAGIGIHPLLVYRTLPEAGDPGGTRAHLEKYGADWVTFTSASTVNGWHALGLRAARPPRMASIGPSTSARLRELGYTVSAECGAPSLEALATAIVQADRAVDTPATIQHHAP